MANPQHPNTSPEEAAEQQREQERIQERLGKINHTLVVLSGKGGVGKSTVALNLAVTLALAGKRVGLLDIDIHGPSIPKMLKLDQRHAEVVDNTIQPILVSNGLKVVSIGFFLPDPDHAVVWRGPMKHNMIQQFIRDVEWGDLDYLVVDCPPGTGDEPLSILKLIGPSAKPIIVTTPQEVALADVRKCINFCRLLNLDILGVIENMNGFVCPHCQKPIDIFKFGGGKQMAEELGIPYLGGIPLDPNIVESGDEGKPYSYFYSKNEAAKAFMEIRDYILDKLN